MSLVGAICDRLGLGASPSRRSSETPGAPLGYGDDWPDGATSLASAGVRVNRSNVMGYSPWWRGVNLIARDVGKLPLRIYRRDVDGKSLALEHPAFQLLRRKPNSFQTAYQFKQLLTGHAISTGNGYAYIYRDGFARPIELLPLNPDETYPVRDGGVVRYVTKVNGEPRKLLAENVFHVKGLGFDGLCGYNVVSMARQSLGLGMAARDFGSVFFKNSAKPSVVLEHPGRLGDKEKKFLKESWERAHSGLENAHRTAILEEGMTLKVVSFNAEDAQLIQTRQFEIREVANFIGVPPHKLGDTTRTAYASLEQENQSYLDDSLDPWLVNWEEEAWDKLLTEREKKADSHVVEFLRAALVRADIVARFNAYAVGINNRILNPNECRSRENMNPYEGGDDFPRPLNTEYGDPPQVAGGKVGDLLEITKAVGEGLPVDAATAIMEAAFPRLTGPQLAKLAGAMKGMATPATPPVVVLPPPAPQLALPVDPTPDPRMAVVEAATRATHADAVKRMMKRLGVRVRRAANHPSDFLAWIDAMPDEHRALVTEALAPSVTALAAIEGKTADPAAAADGLLDGLRESLLSLSGECSPAELEGRVDQLMATLEKRP